MISSRGAKRPGPLLRIAVVTTLATLGVTIPATADAKTIREQQWHLKQLHIAKAHKITRGTGVTVAVVDTGVDRRHPDVQGALLKGKAFPAGDDHGWEDPEGHGTCMASLIAGSGSPYRDGTVGVAPNVKILPVRVDSSVTNLSKGIEWAADHGADIVNVPMWDFKDDRLKAAVDHAIKRGAIVVAAVGTYSDIYWPAAYPGVLAVSATKPKGDLSKYSSSGPEVALSAPGKDILCSTNKFETGYGIYDGTGPAAAIVAGVAALVKSGYPGLDPANLINRLIATADDRGPKGRDDKYGYGMINPVKALTADVPEAKTNPLLPSASPASPTAQADDTSISPGPMTITLISLAAVTMLAIAFVLTLLGATTRRRHTAQPQAAGNLPQNHGGTDPGRHRSDALEHSAHPDHPRAATPRASRHRQSPYDHPR